MKSMHLLLNEAEHAWREDVRRDFPLHSNTPIIRNTTPNKRDWTFETDLKRIFAHISGDENLQNKFETIVAKYWDGNPEELARETLHYLLHHELYHPLEAPFSVIGENNDQKRIHQAIEQGIIQAEPGLSPLKQFVKVQSSQNIVKDFILDNRFYIDNKSREYVRDDVIPIWDLLELQNATPQTNFYTITRFLYGVMYGPQSTHDFFEGKSGKEGVDIAEKALSAIIGKSVQLPRKKGPTIVAKLKSLLGVSPVQETDQLLQEYITSIRNVFSGKDRYEGIKRFMTVLGPYIEKGMPQGRSDMQTESSASPHDLLQDLLDGMTSQEQSEFIQGLAQEDESTLEQVASQLGQKPDSSKLNSNVDEMKNLNVLATHEFYKRNHPAVKIIGGKMIGEDIVIGQQEYWDLKKSSVLTEDQLCRVNLRQIDALQRRTRLPWLIDLGNRTYRLNEYELKKRDIKDIVYVDANIDVPDIVEFYLDSSGSMFGGTAGKYKMNDGSRWDMLSYVFYGFVDALQQGGRKVGKQSKIRIHNFGDSQVDSQLVPADQFWRGDTAALKVFFKPENGYNTYPCIENHNHKGKAAYVICTDGEIKHCDREARKIKALVHNPNNHVILFEIGGTYDLGNAVKNYPNLIYHQVHDKDKMLQAGLEVLLSK